MALFTQQAGRGSPGVDLAVQQLPQDGPTHRSAQALALGKQSGTGTLDPLGRHDPTTNPAGKDQTQLGIL
jgi:hypothetical protein